MFKVQKLDNQGNWYDWNFGKLFSGAALFASRREAMMYYTRFKAFRPYGTDWRIVEA